MYDKVLQALDDDDADPLRTWLADAGIAVERIRGLPIWNADGGAAPAPTHRRGPADLEKRIDDVLPRAIVQASRVDGGYGVALLLIYVLVVCEASWEVSYHYGPIWATLRGAVRHWRAVSAGVDSADAAAAEAAATLLRVLDDEIQVENAMTSSRLAGFSAAARAAAEHAGHAFTLAAVAEPVCPEIAAYVSARASAARIYARAIADASDALERFLAEPGVRLDAAIDGLARAERDEAIKDDHDRSELRGHRFALQALRDDAARDWLHVEAGKIVYVYPFAVRADESERVVARALDTAAEWTLGGMKPTAVHGGFLLDDVWDGSDFRGRRFDGTLVELPRVSLRDLAGQHLATLQTELRLSKLGNHYLRLEGSLKDVDPQDMYAAMFRAAPEHGTAVVTAATDGGETVERSWPRLSDFAVEMATAVGTSLGLPVSTRPGMFHVIAVVQAASLTSGPVGPRREVQTHEQMVGAAGTQVLVNPVTNCVASLAEWARYPLPERTNILETASMRDDMIVRTANTTLLVGLGSPDYHTATRETVAEFVASLDGLFAGWRDELADHFEAIDRYLSDPRLTDETVGAEDLRDFATELRQHQVELHDFAAEARSTVALIESPGLVASPVVATMLHGMLEAARFQPRVDDLNRKVEEVLDDRLGNRIEALARRRAEREAKEEEGRQRIQRARLDTALAVIAAVGISGLGQIIQSGYDLKQDYSLWITASILALAIVVGLLVWTLSARTHRDQRRTDAGRATRPNIPPPRKAAADTVADTSRP